MPPPVQSVDTAEGMVEQPSAHAVPVKTGQSKWMQTVLPFATSFLLHAGLILLAIATYKVIPLVVSPVTEQIIIPDAMIIEHADVGGIPNPGLGDDPMRAAAQAEFADEAAAADAWAQSPTQTLSADLAGGGETEMALIGTGAARSFGAGDAIGPATGADGGAMAVFGVPGGGGGLGPKAPFVGISGNARRVVYLCDATGTMVGMKMELLKRELKAAIDALRPVQSFNVIFFIDGSRVSAVDERGLLVANAANKARAYEFIDRATAFGSPNPIPALQMAFAQQPELIYFLTDGEFDHRFAPVSNAQIFEEIRKLNSENKVRLNTIAFIDRGRHEQWLQSVAEANGGIFRFVSLQELGGTLNDREQ